MWWEEHDAHGGYGLEFEPQVFCGEMGNQRLTGTEFQPGKMKSPEEGWC